MAYLKIIEGKDSGRRFCLQAKNYFELDHNQSLTVHHHHAQNPLFSIIHGSQGWITRLLAGQKLSINGRLTQRAPLTHQDLIGLDEFLFLFEDASPQERGMARRLGEITSQIKTRIKPYKETKLLAHLEKSQKNLKFFYHISRIFNEITDQDTLFQRILAAILDEFAAERGFILMIEPGKPVRCAASKVRAADLPDGFCGEICSLIIQEVLQTREAVISLNTLEDERFAEQPQHEQAPIISAMCAPIFARGEVIGMILLDTRHSHDAFSHSDLELLTGTALQVGLAIQRLQLQALELEKKRLEEDLKAAQVVQRFLLPKQTPQYLAVSIGSKYTLSQGLGGDYYDFLPLDVHQVAVIISDVSGHNIASALVMAMARSVLRSLCKSTSSPAMILEKANHIIKADTTPGMYVTAILAILDLAELSFTYAGAGHNFPLYFQQGQEQDMVELQAGGYPLGLMHEASYQEEKIQLHPQDLLFLYTDGLVEAKNALGERFTKQKLIQCLRQHRQLTGQQLCDCVYQRLMAHCHNVPIADDITIVTLNVKPHYRSLLLKFNSSWQEMQKALEQTTAWLHSQGFGTHQPERLQRILQEVMSNAICHGNQEDPAKQVRLFCRHDQHNLRITVGDEGKGIPAILLQGGYEPKADRARGLQFLKQNVNRIWLNSKGNEITLEIAKHNL